MRVFKYVILSCMILPLNLHAKTSDLSPQIKSFAQEHLLAGLDVASDKIQYKIKPVWEHSNFDDCLEPLDIETTSVKTIGNISLKVSCSLPKWSMYIPIYIGVTQPVAVSKKPLSRGQVLTLKDISLVERDLASLHQGYFLQAQDLVGWSTARTMKEFVVLTSRNLKQPITINKGDKVSIEVNKGGLSVRMNGIALRNGKIGDQIKVKNSRSGKIIVATVVSKGKVLASL